MSLAHLSFGVICPGCQQASHGRPVEAASPCFEAASTCICRHLRDCDLSLEVRDIDGSLCLWARYGAIQATRGVVEIVASAFSNLSSIPAALDQLRKQARRNGAWRLQTSVVEDNEIQRVFKDSGFSVEGYKRDAYRIGVEYRNAALLGNAIAGPLPGPPPLVSDGEEYLVSADPVEIVPAHPAYAVAYMEFDKAVRSETHNLVRTSSETPASVSAYRRQLSDGCSWLAVASGGRVAGAITALSPFGPFTHDDLAIWIAVRRAYWRRGIGRLLTDRLAEWARANGIRRLTAELLSANTGALAFYKRNRFEVEAVRPLAARLSGAYCEELVMGRRL